MVRSIATRVSVPTFSLDRLDDEVEGLGHRRTLRRGQTESLTEVILSLEEPWRSRSLLWLSDRANGSAGRSAFAETGGRMGG
jgi:hypothetical protein